MTPSEFNKYHAKEAHRWSYMSTGDLFSRLQRITVPEKLQMFKMFAEQRQNQYLMDAADAHQQRLLSRMGLNITEIHFGSVAYPSGTTKEVKAKGRYLDI
jgi:hypothetical protein